MLTFALLSDNRSHGAIVKRRDPVEVLMKEDDPEPLIRAIDRSHRPRKVRVFLAGYLRKEITRRRGSPRGGRPGRKVLRRLLDQRILKQVLELHRRGVTVGIAKQMAALKYNCSTRTVERVMQRTRKDLKAPPAPTSSPHRQTIGETRSTPQASAGAGE